MRKPDPETVRTLTPVAAPVCRACISHFFSMRKMKKESKMELEVFEKKREIQQQAMGDVSSAQTGQKAQRSTDIHELMEDESCSLCRSVLREIDTMDGKRRERAIQEYGQFERMMESADSSEEVKDFVKETDVLSQAIVDVI